MRAGMRPILVVAEFQGADILPATLELAAAADRIRELTESRDGTPEIRILVPGETSLDMAREISGQTGLDVIALAWLCEVTPEALLRGLVPVLKDFDPGFVLFAHSTLGREVGPGLAARLGAVSVSGVTRFLSDDEGIGFQRPVMDNALIQTVRPGESCCIMTLAPGAFAGEVKQEDDASPCPGTVLEKEIVIDKAALKTVRREMGTPSGGGPGTAGLKSANIVVAAGRGIGDRENLDKVVEFAGCFSNAAVGASRPLVDQGWIPFGHQVGITGTTVTPELYIACGISGSSQHLAGMSGSKWVVSINTGGDAP